MSPKGLCILTRRPLETGSMVHTAADVGRRVASELDETECALLAGKLLGEAVEDADWDGVRERLVRCGILRAG